MRDTELSMRDRGLFLALSGSEGSSVSGLTGSKVHMVSPYGGRHMVNLNLELSGVRPSPSAR
jgi:hypothetical protein